MKSPMQMPVPTGVVSWETAGTIFVIWIVYQIARMIYNISPLHPLSRFPGPRLAAASYANEFWFDMIRGGRYTREIKRLHGIYGPIIRINPDELHCNDPNFMDEIYASGSRKRNKMPHHMSNVPSSQAVSHFATLDHDLHRKRRAAISKFFSKAQILRLEPKVHALVQKLCDKLLAESRTPNRPFNVADAYSCFTGDLISGYCFGESFGFLEQDSWLPNFRAATYSVFKVTYLFKFFPFFKSFILAGPWLARVVPREFALLIDTFQVNIPKRVESAIRDRKSGVAEDDANPNVFAALFSSDLPPEEKTAYRLTGESTNLIFAGTETVSSAVAVLTFHILFRPDVLARLTDELRTVVDDPRQLPGFPTLERLPFLGATLLEGLRLFYGQSLRSARIATGEDLVYRGKWTPERGDGEVEVSYVVPRGWAMSMTSVLLHHDERVFPDSHKFKPERWLDERGERRRDLEKYLFTFSKGSRQCLGINLAYCELYLTLAALILRVFPRMQLYETTKREVEYDHCMTVAIPVSTKGIRVTVS